MMPIGEVVRPIARELGATGAAENADLRDLFRAANVVRYLRMGIVPKWIDERELAPLRKFSSGPTYMAADPPRQDWIHFSEPSREAGEDG
jgi:hypothetical protein